MPPAPMVCPVLLRPPSTRRNARRPPRLAGFGAAWLSVMAYVLIGTYIGLAALAP